MNKESILRVGLPIAAVIASVGIGFAGLTSAQTASTTGTATTGAAAHVRGIGMMGRLHGGFAKGGPRMGAMGTVTAVSGNTVTITGKDGTSYTVDASAAKVSKMTSITTGDIQVGDTIGVHGAVSGTNITAKNIMDGLPGQGIPPAPQQ